MARVRVAGLADVVNVMSYGRDRSRNRLTDSGLAQLLGEQHEDAAGAADVGELVDVFVGGYSAKWTASVPGGYIEGLVDVVDGEGDAVHADLVGSSGLDLDRFGVDVLKEFEATVTVRRL